MDAGTKLDESVAEKVLGWRREGERWRDPARDEPVALPRFSTDVAAAFELADRILDHGFRLRLEGKKIWNARFYKSAAHTLETHAVATTGSSPAEAICLAALAVAGGS